MALEQLPCHPRSEGIPSPTRSELSPGVGTEGAFPWMLNSALGVGAALYICYSCILYGSLYFFNPTLFQFFVIGNNSLYHLSLFKLLCSFSLLIGPKQICVFFLHHSTDKGHFSLFVFFLPQKLHVLNHEYFYLPVVYYLIYLDTF